MLYLILRKRKDRLKRNLEKLTGATWIISEDDTRMIFCYKEKKVYIIFHKLGEFQEVDMTFFNFSFVEDIDQIRETTRRWFVGCFQESDDDFKRKLKDSP
jgi:hypothetical protein